MCRCGRVGKGAEPPGGAVRVCARHGGQELGSSHRSIAVSPASNACVGCAVFTWLRLPASGRLPDRAEQEKVDPGAKPFLQVCC